MRTTTNHGERGSTLIQALVALGILGLITYLMSTQLGQGLKGAKDIETRYERENLSRDVLMTLSGLGCDLSLKGATINPTATGRQLTNLTWYRAGPGGTKGSKLLEKDLKAGPLLVTGVGVRVTGNVSNLYHVDLEYDVQPFNANTVLSAKAKTYKHKLVVSLDAANVVQRCAYGSSGSAQVNVAIADFHKYHTELPTPPAVVCDPNEPHWRFSAACNRVCSSGCLAGSPACKTTPLPGLGYTSGFPSECSEPSYVTCTCVN